MKISLSILVIIVSCVGLAGAWYWFQYRPLKIRQFCYEEVSTYYSKLIEGGRVRVLDKVTNQQGTIPNDDLETYSERYKVIQQERSGLENDPEYNNCLIKKGLEINE